MALPTLVARTWCERQNHRHSLHLSAIVIVRIVLFFSLVASWQDLESEPEGVGKTDKLGVLVLMMKRSHFSSGYSRTVR